MVTGCVSGRLHTYGPFPTSRIVSQHAVCHFTRSPGTKCLELVKLHLPMQAYYPNPKAHGRVTGSGIPDSVPPAVVVHHHATDPCLPRRAARLWPTTPSTRTPLTPS